MCIICIKPAGRPLPDHDDLERSWEANPDGAGIMYNEAGKVHVKKGLMTKEAFFDAYDKLRGRANQTIVFHFRIATHGGVSREMTHPFPVTSDPALLKSANVRARYGFAHNGIFSDLPKEPDFSDSAILVRDYLSMAPMDNRKFVSYFLSRACYGYSKTVVLYADGGFVESGSWERDDAGRLWSNNGYKYAADLRPGWAGFRRPSKTTQTVFATSGMRKLPKGKTAFGDDGTIYIQDGSWLGEGEDFYTDDDSALYIVRSGDIDSAEFVGYVTDSYGDPL
jgi:hypothetical protein